MNISDIKNSRIYAFSSYTKAFTRLCDDMKSKYPLQMHKGLDIGRLYEKYLPIIAQAERNKDKKMYLGALVDFVGEFRDGHVNVCDTREFFGFGSDGELSEVKKTRFTSCYGLSLLRLDDGRYVAVNITQSGAAFVSGIREGDEIVFWNGLPVAEALAKLDVLIPVRSNMFADSEIKDRYKGFYLSCMSGRSVSVTYRNTAGELCTAHMDSEGNGYLYLRDTIGKWSNRVNGGRLFGVSAKRIVYENREGYYYIRIAGFDGSARGITKAFDKIASEIEKNSVSRIILDVRNNSGGEDSAGALAVSYFASQNMTYLREGHYNEASGAYVPCTEITVEARNKITVPVTLLINSQCISAGEGFVYNMAKLPQVTVVGLSGTNGSFGSFSGVCFLPGRVLMVYPDIVCLDENNTVIIDSGKTKSGGIKPDVFIPLDGYSARLLFTTDRDYELEYALELNKSHAS